MDTPSTPPPSTPAPATRTERGEGRGVLTFLVAAIALVVGTVGVVGAWTDESPAGVALSNGGVAAAPVEFDITLGDLFVEPASIEVPAGAAVTLHVRNTGAMGHDLKVNGTDGTELLAPGTSATIEIGSFTASTQAWCTVAGHRQAGMVLDIVVVGSSGGDATAAGGAMMGDGMMAASSASTT